MAAIISVEVALYGGITDTHIYTCTHVVATCTHTYSDSVHAWILTLAYIGNIAISYMATALKKLKLMTQDLQIAIPVLGKLPLHFVST